MLMSMKINNVISLFAAGVDLKSTKQFETKNQKLHRLQEGITFGDGDEYTPAEYLKMASETSLRYQESHYPRTMSNGMKTPEEIISLDSLEQDYWRMVEGYGRKTSVEYGNDIDTAKFWSGFPLSERGRAHNGTSKRSKAVAEPEFGTDEYYKETWWNLNNISSCPGSVLRHVKCKITGINIPWLYFGCLFSTFCWHNEDNYLYSINYHHSGAPKQWYGVPGTREDADGLEHIFKSNLAAKMRDVPDLLHHITTMFSPRLLQRAKVPVYKLTQHSGEFVVTFPRAFHGGFSFGPNIGEAVNFATPDWISHGSDANERYRSYARTAVFSHDRLTFTLSHFMKEHTHESVTLLEKELERVIAEELRLRTRLLEQGVRDISSQITLPKNRLDQLDEDSADYDDKRLCFSCKHVCFFSAVACECSQSKVSCLRHSHFMCKCKTNRRYLMIWSSAKEMTKTLERVKERRKILGKKVVQHIDLTKSSLTSIDKPLSTESAPGIDEDLMRHKSYNLEGDLSLKSFSRVNFPGNKPRLRLVLPKH